MDDITWVHTVPCRLCQGRNVHYAHRPGCRGCVALMEYLHPHRPDKPVVPKAGGLTERQYQVASMSAMGLSYPEISERLGIAVTTVSNTMIAVRKKRRAIN